MQPSSAQLGMEHGLGYALLTSVARTSLCSAQPAQLSMADMASLNTLLPLKSFAFEIIINLEFFHMVKPIVFEQGGRLIFL